MVSRKVFRRLAVFAAGAVVTLAVPAGASAARAHTCGAEGPQTLEGNIAAPVEVVGTCLVDGGQAKVRGALTVEPGGQLIANFAFNTVRPGGANPRLLLFGNLTVKEGGVAIIGCEPFYFTCSGDEENTATSRSVIRGNLNGRGAAGIILHAARIFGNVNQVGGGAPESECAIYSDYEDDLIHGNVTVRELDSCWLGLARDRVFGDMRIENNHFEDPDAIEILANRISRNLTCKGNGMVWNSREAEFGQEPLYPRVTERNTVGGKRGGQCVHSSPETLAAYERGEFGEGAF